jgi:hypothetical protein
VDDERLDVHGTRPEHGISLSSPLSIGRTQAVG